MVELDVVTDNIKMELERIEVRGCGMQSSVSEYAPIAGFCDCVN